MALPSNGRVVIVDDEIEKEALPLIQALSKRGIPVRFFNGRASTLPEQPVGEVRLLFLDLKLEGLDFSIDEDHTAQALKGIVEKIIGPENGPYVIFGWTKHPHHLSAVVDKLPKKPVLVLDMQKSECIIDGSCDLSKIEAKLSKKLTEIGSYRLLFEWENLVNDSASDTVNEVCHGEPITESLESILYRIAEANWGEENTRKAHAKRRTKAALHIFNSLLGDSIERRLNSTSLSGLKKPASNTLLDPEFLSKFNSKMLLSQKTDKKPYPGSVYFEFNVKRKRALQDLLDKLINNNKIDSYVKKKINTENPTVKGIEKEKLINKATDNLLRNIRKEAKKIFVEVTPVCDYSQSQAKHHRIIPGIIVKKTLLDFLQIGKNEIAYYKSDSVYIDSFSDAFVLIFDFRGFQTIDIDSLKNKKVLFRLRQEMLFDMQHKVGSHFSRPGTVSLRE